MSEISPNAAIKRRQRLIIGGAAASIICLIVAGLFLFDTAPKVKDSGQKVNIAPPGDVSQQDAWRGQQAAQEKLAAEQLSQQKAFLAQLTDKVDKLEKDSSETRQAQKSTEDKLKDLEKKGGGQKAGRLNDPLPNNNRRVLEKPGTPLDSSLSTPLTQTRPQSPDSDFIRFNNSGPRTALANGDAGGKTEVVGFPSSEAAKQYATTRGTKGGALQRIEFIPANSIIRVAMLNGLDAPAGGQAQNNPLPVILHVLDPANLPSKYKLDVRDCRISAAGYGDLSSERAILRTDTFSCVLKNGQTIEMPLKGHVVGEDGKVGVRGQVVSKQGQLLANAALAGISSGIGRAFNQSASTVMSSGIGTTSTIDPSRVGQAAIGSGFGEAGNALAQYYIRAAEKIFPVIEVGGGRIVEVAVTKGAIYTGQANLGGGTYSSLLKRNGNARRSERYEED